MFKVYTIGGYSEVGKNMTAVDFGEDIIVFDCGLYLPAVIDLQETEKQQTPKMLKDVGALPDDEVLMKQKEKVRAILISHAHLDHVGAVQHMAHKYPNALIVGTPFTIEVLKILMEDSKTHLKNKIVAVKPDNFIIIKGKNKSYKVDFVSITHSTLQTTIIALHTPNGTICYANDFKLDKNPTMGNPPNYKKMLELSRKGVKLLIVDSLYSGTDIKTPSEKIARALVEEALLTVNHRGSGIVVTTFSSHIARLKSIVEFSRKLNRKIIFVGRSLNKYITAAKKINQYPFGKDIQIVSYKNQIKSVLKNIEKERAKYVLICTGHQAEPGSVLDRIVKGEHPFKLRPGDSVIFASKIIPVPINISARAQLDKKIKNQGVRILDNVHVSVLPSTEVVINDSGGIKIKEISSILGSENKEMKVPAFDQSDFKIKWYNAQVVAHPYKGKIFNIKTKSGRNVSITSGHSLFKLEKGALVSEKGDNLKIGDFLAIPKRFSWHKEIKEIDVENYIALKNKHYERKDGLLFYNKKPICNLKIKLTNEFAKLLGYYLAEGSAPRHISLVIGKHETDILEEIKKLIKNSFPYANINITDKGTSYEICFGARILKSLFKGWFGDNARTKKIPKFVFSSNNEFKLNFLGTYLNGDGCIDKGKDYFRIRVKTASKKLASDLLYLFSQVGICAKFDHIEINKPRKISGNKNYTPETLSYVIRIQNIEYLNLLKGFLSDKFKSQIENKLSDTKFSQHFPPESLPIDKIDFNEIEPKTGTYLYNIKYYNSQAKRKKYHISQNLLAKQATSVTGFTKKILDGDLLFDPIKSIETNNYDGIVYDFSVPEAENFIGGFGGIILHNSGHGGEEDIRELVSLLKPKIVIPSHGSLDQLTPAIELFREMGYQYGKTCYLMQDGGELVVN